MEWLIGCWVLVGFGCWFWYKKQKKKEKEKREKVEEKRGIPQGKLGWPFIGETLDFIACGYSAKPVSFMEKRKSQYGKVFKTNILGTPIIVSTDPEVNKVVLQNQGSTFIPAYPKSVRELMGEHSILRTNGNLHRRVHALIGRFLKSPQFKARITRDIEDSVKLMLASWKHMNLICVQEEVKKVTFQVLVKTLISIGPGDDLDFIKREFDELIKGLICLPINFPGTRLYKSLKAKERLFKMVKKVVEERRKVGMDTEEEESSKGINPRARDVVDVLLRDRDELNERQLLPLDFIVGNVIEMMIPGEETMPTAMTLAVKFLGDSPVALKQIREENMELKKKKADSCDDYSWADYMSLTFTQNVISETLRMANIINAVWRKAVKDVEIKGNLIPKGWCVLASFTSVHMNEEYYQNPYQFDPWRWELNLSKGKTGGAVMSNCFTPFGGGQRLCPGLELSRLEIAIFLHHLVTSYRWVAEEDEIVYFPTVKMKRKLPIRITSATCSHWIR